LEYDLPALLKARPIIGIAFIIGMPLITVYLISFLCAKSEFFYDFPIPIQDCEMTETTLKGSVIDIQGNPIPNAEIHFENTPVDNSTPVKREILSDKNGNIGPESISLFKCEPINFTVSASGFRKKLFHMYLTCYQAN
jgi:hypothetical protein